MKRPTRNGFHNPLVFLLMAALACGLFVSALAASPATAQTLSGADIRLLEGTVGGASTGAQSNDSGTLQLIESSFGLLGAGHSQASSGIQLYVGVAPVPEPGALVQLAAGALGLTLLERRRRRRSPRLAPASSRISISTLLGGLDQNSG